MTETELEHVLARCTETVLEQMFFVRALNESIPAPDAELSVEVRFAGEPSGRLLLRISSSAARLIAGDFLGEDESGLSEQQVAEVICELANIICGSVLSQVGTETTFRLDAPHLEHGPSVLDPNAVVDSVALDNGNLLIAFSAERQLCPANRQSAS